MAVDWSLYDSDVTRLYIKENKSAETVISFLKTTYNVNISIRQFKHQYGGRKNIQAHEWRAIIEVIRKRESESKESEVYVNNRKVSPTHVQRAFHLHEKGNGGRRSAVVDLGIDTINKKRIEIRTPQSQATNSSELSDQEVECVITSTHAQGNHDSLSIIPVAEGVFFEDMDFENIEHDLRTPTVLSLPTFNNFQLPSWAHTLPCSLSPISLGISATNDGYQIALPNCTGREILPHGCPTLWPRAESFASLLPESFGASEPALELTQFFWDLPEIRLMFPFLTDGPVSSDIRESHIPNAWPSCQKCVWLSTNQLSSYLISVHPKLESLRATTDQLQTVLQYLSHNRHHRPGGLYPIDNELYPEDSTFESSYQVLAIVTYLACNNIMVGDRLTPFMEWVTDSGYLSTLVDFLGMKSPYVLVLATEIAKIMSTGQIKFKNRRDFIGVYKRDFIETYPNEALNLLRAADPRIFSGDIGFRLLQRVIRFNHLQVAEFIIKQSTPVGWTEGYHKALIEAWVNSLPSHSDHIPMLQLLLQANTTDVGFRYPTDLEPALRHAISYGDLQAISLLLNAGAKLNVNMLRGKLPETSELYATLNLNSAAGEILNVKCLIQAASRGTRSLSRFLFEHGIFQDHILQWALCIAIGYNDIAAVRTLLSHGVDPEASKFHASCAAQRMDEFSEHEGAVDRDGYEVGGDTPLFLALGQNDKRNIRAMVYLLRKAGAQLNPERFCRSIDQVLWEEERTAVQALAAAGFDITLVGPYALTDAAARNTERRMNERGIDECGLLLDAGCPINEYGFEGLSALQTAVRERESAIAHFLLERGADVNLPASDNGGLTALQAGATTSDIDLVECLLDAGADVNAPPAKIDGLTVLEATTHFHLPVDPQDCIALFKKLLCAGAPIKRPDGTTGKLLQSIIRAYVPMDECLKLVLDAGASAEDLAPMCLANGIVVMETPLQAAACCLNLDAVRTLLGHRANINAPASPNHGYTALQAAVMAMNDDDLPPTSDQIEMQAEVVMLLLRHDANVNAPPAEEFGRTALQGAITNLRPNPKIIQLLLEHGAHVNAPPARKGGVTALQGAAIQGDLSTARLLLGRGANINAPAAPEEGRTAIEGAAEHGRLEMVRFLLANGATPTSSNGFSRAIELARDNDRWHIVDMLGQYKRAASFHQLSSS